MKKYISTLLCGLLFAVSLKADEPKPPAIIGIEHALSERMLSPQAKKPKLAIFQKNKSQITASESFDLGDGISLIYDENDLTGTLLEVKVSAIQWSELVSHIYFLPRLKEINNHIYSKLNDDFDFVIYVLNTPKDENIKTQLGFHGLNARVQSSVQGLGLGKHDLSSEWGTEGKLMSAIYFPYFNAISAGPSLHELLHSWPAFISPTYDLGKTRYQAHWGISNANGQIGGFKYARIVEENYDGVEGKTLYQASRSPKTKKDGSFQFGGFGINANEGNGTPYSDIELYLMGLKSAQELRDTNFQLEIYSGNDYQPETFVDGYFSSTKKTTYTIDDIITKNGARVPDASVSQKQFKVLTVVLTPETATENFRSDIMRDINWLAGEMKDATYPHLFNFRQATGDRGSLIVNNLTSSLKTPITIVSIENISDGVDENIAIHAPELIPDDEMLAATALVYPNPTDGKFTLEYETQAEAYNISLADSRGNVLLRRRLAEPVIDLDLKNYPSGVYQLTIEDGKQIITKKIIKN